MPSILRADGPYVRSTSIDQTWATFSVDLHLDLVGRRVRAELENALRNDVRTGRLRPGMRLPSSRALALDLGIARNTVANAYDQLVAEGWLTARRGSGTQVAQRAAPQRSPPRRTGSQATELWPQPQD
jgi:GntR family transcriptional regulator / MocR family aminotransferase